MSKYVMLDGAPYFEVIYWIDSDFYPLPDPLPENIVPVSEEIFQIGGNWCYFNGEVVPFYGYLWNMGWSTASNELQKADITMIRTMSAGLPVPQEWLDYKVELRNRLKIPRDVHIAPPPLIARPPYPVGS